MLFRSEQIGSPSDLYDRPTNRFVASFIGETNFIEGVVVGATDGMVTVNVAGAAVRAGTSRDLPAGTPVVLAVRPEKIVFRESPRAHGSDLNALPVIVRDVTFVGEIHRYVLEIGPSATAVLKQQHRFPIKPRAVSERAEIEWHMQDTLIEIGRAHV